MLKFKFNKQGKEEEISFKLSKNREIDSTIYSWLEVNGKENLNYLSLDDRVKILNSWLNDNIKNNSPIKREVLLTGSRTITNLKGEKRDFINFASNDYLGLSHHPKVIDASKTALEQYGAGSCGSPMSNGTTIVLHELEQKIADFKGCEDAIVQSSGYGANIGAIKTLLRENDVLIFDMYAHASLLDGVTNTNINHFFFKHNDVNHLESILKKASKTYTNILVVVEGVYSMDGDIPPLDDIFNLTKKYKARLLVDEAHATGIIGENGRGATEMFQLEGKVDVVTGTMSKALGSVGGFITGKREMINYLRYTNKHYIFTAAPFIPSMAAVNKAIEIINDEPEIRKNLLANITFLNNKLSEMCGHQESSETPIFPIMIGDEVTTMNILNDLRNTGIFTLSAVYPGVPKGQARLRVSITAEHTFEQLDYLCNQIKKCFEQNNLI